MKTVITYGTFDLFHVGHLRMLERAKALTEGGTLIVAVSTDEFNQAEKKKQAVIPYAARSEIVRALRCVDKVIPETSWEQKVTDIQKYGIDVFVIGEDWKGKFDFLTPHCHVHYLSRTPEISTTDIKITIAKG